MVIPSILFQKAHPTRGALFLGTMVSMSSTGAQPECLSVEEVLKQVEARPTGLTAPEVAARHKLHGLNTLNRRSVSVFGIVLRQLTGNPLILILAGATAISYLLGQHISSYYIFAMILLSVALGFWNEFGAERTVEALLKRISATAFVLRNNIREQVPVSEVTIGDIVLLSRGDIAPADLRLLSVNDLQMNESTLTGESKTTYKTAEVLEAGKHGLSEMSNRVFMGTSVDNGVGKGVVLAIGRDTEFGKIVKSAAFTKPQTEFEKGLMNFGNMLVTTIVVLCVGIFIVNFGLGHPLLDSLLFALAIAVGLTPELLPVIVTISLAHGAGKLAKKKVIAKQLIAIENLGNMDVLCTDKTGTLTEGNITLMEYANLSDQRDPAVLIAALNANEAMAHNQITGSGIDAALWKYALKENIKPSDAVVKVDEEPFDFVKKAMFAVVEEHGTRTFIVKGAPDFVLAHSDHADTETLTKKFTAFNNDGLRVAVVALKTVEKKDDYTWDDAQGLTILGYTTFLDVPKKGAKRALEELRDLHVDTKIITGDNELVTKKICQEVGMEVTGIITGSEIDALSDEQLKEVVISHNVFARLTPDNKLRIIASLHAQGHVVGFMGDGINDITALRGADVGISVDTAVDVAKEAASIVLLDIGLDVICQGIREGRRTFSNTLKYILMGTSSNFGNMFSAAGASFILPFLPMSPVQILVTNGVYDLSQLSIPTDNVDKEALIKPRHWNIDFIKKYMLFFGPLSSIYDFLTFGAMFLIIQMYYGTGSFAAHSALFQTGWFIESVMTEILVVFVIRTSRSPFFRSRPSPWLLWSCLSMVGLAVLIPFTRIGADLGFVAPPAIYFVVLIILVSTYLVLVESMKRRFLNRLNG